MFLRLYFEVPFSTLCLSLISVVSGHIHALKYPLWSLEGFRIPRDSKPPKTESKNEMESKLIE